MVYQFKETEERIQKFWNEHAIYAKAKEKCKDGKPFYFLDGPPYTSGKVHIGTAWNKSLKDAVLRYKRMRGFNVWDRAGYDMHGLPTENATEKKLGISGKEEIVRFGVEKFITECKKLCVENMLVMNEDFKRLGVWMDFEHAYQSISKEYIEGIWWLIKRAHEQKRLYKGLRTMHWCAESATAVAKHELEYQNVTDDSVYVKLPVQGEKDTFFVVWTTTPWTLPFNLAIMANPKVAYQYCSVNGETWIIAKDLASKVLAQKCGFEFTVKKEVKGKKLEGMKYHHPFFAEIPYFKEYANVPALHSVVLSKEYVDTVSGTGLVHCAPGCGPEDYEVGHKNGLLPFNAVNEQGIFENCGPFTGLRARKDDKKCIALFEEKGVVVAKEKYRHDYPHDWRTHEPVIFRTTTQWFFKVEDIKKQMIRENRKIKWVPEAAYNAFTSWLENLRDNSVSKQRFWGTPLPIWEASDGEYIVIESVAELEQLSGVNVKELHIPWIDAVTFKDHSGKLFKRVPDVLDVWVDAGSASWNCLDYPQNKEFFEKFFPAEFILEGKDQIRGWFNLLMVASMLSMSRPSFKKVYMHGFVQDALGRKMSKSLGNYILPGEVIDQYGADTLRYYMIGGAAPGIDINYNFDDMKLKYKNLGILWNLQNYFIDLVRTTGLKPRKINADKLELEEEYILAKLQETIARATEAFEDYRLNELPWIVEAIFLETSRTYVQQIRDKVSLGDDEEKQVVVDVMYHLLLTSLKLLAPIVPHLTEDLYQRLKEELSRKELKEESVHHCAWPKVDKTYVDPQLITEVEFAKDVMQAILAGREHLRLGVRWPLKEVVIVTDDKALQDAVAKLDAAIKTQTNVHSLKLMIQLPGVQETATLNMRKLGEQYKSLVKSIVPEVQKVQLSHVLDGIRREGKYSVHIDGQEIALTKEHLNVERKVPEQYVAVDMKNAVVYIDKTRTHKLDIEGYARELMRRIQVVRKEGGLQKNDRITLEISTPDAEMTEAVHRFTSEIKEKCGITELSLTTHFADTQKKDEIRGKTFSLQYQRV